MRNDEQNVFKREHNTTATALCQRQIQVFEPVEANSMARKEVAALILSNSACFEASDSSGALNHER
ncbi:MAG: hypothetical protein AABM67_00420 [Acidobacteriota bacterium]